MLYTSTTLDRSTGDLITRDLGDWVTVTEYGRTKGLGPRQIRRVLHHAGLLAPEGKHGHYRLPYAKVAAGHGKRHDRPRKGFPFDVLSPACQALLDSEWEFLTASFEEDDGDGHLLRQARDALGRYEAERQANRMTALDGHGRTLWVRDHFPDLTHAQIADLVGIGRQKVSKYLAKRDEDRESRHRPSSSTGQGRTQRLATGHAIRLSEGCSCRDCGGLPQERPMAA